MSSILILWSHCNRRGLRGKKSRHKEEIRHLKPWALDLAPFYISIILAAFSMGSTAYGREMSSKRDCAICHIMWLDDFRTDKKTLIKWQPTNVLMKDTQGVVSSEEVCYSCHDGYVEDSRHNVWSHNNHKTFVKPSNSITIPSTLPLSNKDEIYCGTCHSAHGPGADPDAGPSGPMSFMRERNVDSSLCKTCHRDEATYKRTNGHPLYKTKMRLPDILFKFGSKITKERDKIICQTCHSVHGAKGDNITVIDNKASELCIACHHRKKVLIGTKHDLRSSLTLLKNIKQRSPSESGPCSACHVPHKAGGVRLWARPVESGNPATSLCLTCHGEEADYKIKGIGNYSHPINVRSRSKSPLPNRLPLYSANATKSPQGEVQCFTCHDVHRWDPNSSTNKGSRKIDGDASNSFLRIANNTSSTLCVECHGGKKDVITSDHNLKVTAPKEKNLQGFGPGASGPCGACHLPHNAAGDGLWARKLKPGNPSTQLCLSCHGEETGQIKKQIGRYSHPIDVDLDSKIPREHDLPLFLKDATEDPAGKIQCSTCHDVHRWDPESTTDKRGENIEGDGSNSFLRIANISTSHLCLRCHKDKGQVVFSDHNLKVTAAEEKNLQGYTSSVSGPCGSCHIPHNAAGDRLWAKPLSDDRDFFTQVCTGCHNKGGAAEAKQTGDNSHPVDVKIDHYTPVDRKRIAQNLPLFHVDGERESGERMICMTCHEPHTWSPNKRSAGMESTMTNMEGDITNSFLRKENFPASDLCKICHKDKALVLGTDHDLNVTAPDAKNLLGQTVKESGPCGVCHIVHNSPNRLKLWARPFGPIQDNESIMNRLCTSCHSQGETAEDKIPRIATHPEEKLINNRMRIQRGEKDYTPLFDEDGKEVVVGNISCPSCHNAHQWSPLLKKKGSYENIEGRAVDSFLRTTSYNTVCRDCHGIEALYRYIYFHSPDKRSGNEVK